MTVSRHLAQLNIARLRHPIDDPRIADFVDALPTVNGAGEQSPGYVWRLQSEGGDATDIRVFDDALIIVNLPVWQSLADLKAFAYRGLHRDFFRRRSEWFVDGASRTALWWLPATTLPTTDDAKGRLDFIDAFGPSPYAFEMGQNHPPLVVRQVDAGDAVVEPLLADMTWHPKQVLGDDHAFVIAELDDRAAACGGYRRLDHSTAELTRMHVTEAARGLRVGAALVAELAAIAGRAGAERLLFETGPRNLPSLPLYEKYGFRRIERWGDHLAPTAICLEKSLTG
jgi:GNAT superfamily N-acetyltransferase